MSNIQANLTLSADYRSGKIDTMTFAAGNGKPARTIIRVIHSVEIDGVAFKFSEELPDTTPITTWAQPFPRGTMVKLGLCLEETQNASVVNGRAVVNRGLWRVQVAGIAREEAQGVPAKSKDAAPRA